MKHCKAYIDAVAREADLRVHGIILDLDAYVALRRENSGVRFCHELASGVLDVDLPDEVVEHPKFLRMHLAAVDMVCWANVSATPLRSALIQPLLTIGLVTVIGPVFVQCGTGKRPHDQQHPDRSHA